MLKGGDYEPNPGPSKNQQPKYPCGTCNKEVTWKCQAVCCNNSSCEKWFHIDCQGIPPYIYKIMDNSNIAWECINCGMPNFATTFFNTTIESENSFSALDTDLDNSNIGPPTHTSSPISKSASKNQHRKKRNTETPMRTLTINFQSIKNKKPELDHIIESCKPDIIFGSETWLSGNISPYEYIPASEYTIYNKDRKDGYGGVLIAISNKYLSSKAPEKLNTDCEVVWATINTPGNKTLYLGSYYRPPSDKGESLNQLNASLSKVCNENNANVWLSGDFNLGHIDWSIPAVITGKPDQKMHTDLLDTLQDNNLTQVNTKPTRNEKILDLLCVTNPSLVNRIENNATHRRK